MRELQSWINLKRDAKVGQNRRCRLIWPVLGGWEKVVCPGVWEKDRVWGLQNDEHRPGHNFLEEVDDETFHNLRCS